MKRVLFPLLTCSLLAACGGGVDVAYPEPSGTSATVSGNVLLPANLVSAASLGAQAVGAQSLDVQSLDVQSLDVQSLDAQAAQSQAGIGQADWSLPHVAGEVLIVGAAGSVQLPGALSSLSVQDTGAGGIQRVQTPAGETDAAFAARLAQVLTSQQGLGSQGMGSQGLGAPGSVVVQPNYIYSALSVPNDPGYPVQDSAHPGVFIGGTAYDQDYLSRINAVSGWDSVQAQGKPVTGAVTAVLDTGIDRSHPEFRGRLLPGYDFAGSNGKTPDADPSEAQGGDIGHGTSSAGLIGAAGNNGVGIAGLTWTGQTLLPVKVFDDNGGASTVTLGRAVDYAVAQGARVVNMSLGLKGANTDTALAKSLQAAARAGVVLVASAGNTPGDGLYYPASDPNVLAVGALGSSDALACYSARPSSGQKALDLVAPGGNAAQANGQCNGDFSNGILSLAPVGQGNTGSVLAQGGYGLRIGTSESAPLVSGAASLIRGVRPDLGASQVRSVLTTSAKTVAGGKLLDVGAAMKAALALPQNPARAYTLTVQAGGVSKTFTGTLPAGTSSVPYTLSGVPIGQTTLAATLNIGGQAASGTLNVNVTGDLSGQNIQTR
jgi:subtilisin family serine protease